MSPQTPSKITPQAPKNGVIAALDAIWHREGPLTAADLRTLNAVSQNLGDLYNALDFLTVLSTEEVEDLENQGGQDSAKATRIVQARQAMARFNDLTLERVDPESIDIERLDDVVNEDAPKP